MNNDEHENQKLKIEEDSAVAVKPGSEAYYWATDLVCCLTAVILIFTFVVRIVGIDGSSMVPTLHDRDWVLLLDSTIYDEPQVGDVVVIYKKSYGKPIVKRIIATEGQTIDIDFNSHEVYVDGVLQDEPFINEPTAVWGDVQFPQTVPEGCVFVMGDNRNNSTDSRFSMIGMVDERCILGKVLFRIMPLSDFGKVR